MEISRTMARMLERPDIDGSRTDSKTLAFDMGKQSRRISIGLVRGYFGVMTKMRSNRAGGAGTDTPIFLGFEDDGVHLCQHPQRDSNDDDASHASQGQFITVPLDSGRSTSPMLYTARGIPGVRRRVVPNKASGAGCDVRDTC